VEKVVLGQEADLSALSCGCGSSTNNE